MGNEETISVIRVEWEIASGQRRNSKITVTGVDELCCRKKGLMCVKLIVAKEKWLFCLC